MRTLKRDRSILHCRTCGKEKSCREFYVSNLSICMDCKREKVQAYKQRTDYNRAYRLRKDAA